VDAGIERGAQGDHGAKILAEERVTLDALVEETRKMGSETGLNVVAFSGGVDSSLVAYLVHRAFPRGRAAACIGISESLSARQLATAREVAREMGFKLLEVETREIEDERYARNTGDACLYCKRALYGTIEAVAVRAKEELALAVERRKQMRENRFTSKFTRIFAGRGKNGGGDGSNPPMSTVDAGDGDVVMTDLKLFNGTNRDDLKDLTRLGIAAAAEFNVQSPLCNISKADVRRLALVRPMLGITIDRGQRMRTSDMLHSPPQLTTIFASFRSACLLIFCRFDACAYSIACSIADLLAGGGIDKPQSRGGAVPSIEAGIRRARNPFVIAQCRTWGGAHPQVPAHATGGEPPPQAPAPRG